MPSIDLTDDQVRILQGDQENTLIAIPYYDGRRIGGADLELPVSGGQVTDDGAASVTHSGSLLISDANGEFVPNDYMDVLSPFGTELYILSEHRLGDLSTRIPIGYFRVEELPGYQEMKDRYRTGQWVHRGASINVTIKGRLANVDDDKFEAPEFSAAGAGTWAELARIARMAVTRSDVADKTIGSQINYEDDRLAAVALLAANIDGIPYETPTGTLSVRPKVPDPTPVWKLAYGDAGGVVTPPRSLSRKGFANVFVTRNEQGASGAQVQGRAVIESGPLRAGGPMGYIPRFKNNPLVTTVAAANADAATTRDNAIRSFTYQISVQALPNPALIPGDTVSFDYFDETIDATVLKTTLPHHGLQTLDLQVATGASPWG